MKRVLIALVVVFCFASLAWGEPPVRKVQVVNDSLNVDIVNQPVDVTVVNQADPICYEYHGIQKSNLLECLGQLNEWTKDGWELVYFYSISVSPYYYTAVIRRPTECNPSP